MLRAQKTFLVISVFLLSSFILSCSFTDNSDEIPSYENLNYNPSVEELKLGGIPIVEINTIDGTNIDSKENWKESNFKYMILFYKNDLRKKGFYKWKFF